MQSKVNVIDKSIEKTCNKCNGNGCDSCKNGIYKEGNYIIVSQDNKGQKIAFQSDFAGK